LQENEAGGMQAVGMAMNHLTEIETLSADYQQLSENVQNSYYMLQETASDISRQLDLLEMDEGRLETVEQRLDLIRQLKRKYGETVEIILAYYQQISQELLESQDFETQNQHLEENLIELEQQATEQAKRLSQARKRMARSLEKAIQQQLSELYMDKARFQVRFKECADLRLSEQGIDDVEFYLATNPGEELKPLVKVASG